MRPPIRLFARRWHRRRRWRLFFGAYCRHASEWTPSVAEQPRGRFRWVGGASGPERVYLMPDRVWGAVAEQGFTFGITTGDPVEAPSMGVEIPGRRACVFGCWAVEALVWTRQRKMSARAFEYARRRRGGADL